MDELIKKVIKALETSTCNEVELTDGSIKVRDELIKKAIKALETSTCNEVELTDGSIKVRVVKFTPPQYNYAYTYPYPYQDTTSVPVRDY